LAQRRLVWSTAILLLLLLAITLTVPPVRAAVLEFLQIGAIRIFQIAPTPAPSPTLPPVEQTPPVGLAPASPTVTSLPTPVDIVSLLDLAGRTSLEEARQKAAFPLRLPTYPPDLGAPSHVFMQDMGGEMIVLVWTDPEQPDQVRLSLHAIAPGSWAGEKVTPLVVQETTVNGQPAAWTVGPYLLYLRTRDLELRRLIDGHVLVWTQDDVTYRLETSLPLDEAIRIAESLQ
jgi:hypothetical protein